MEKFNKYHDLLESGKSCEDVYAMAKAEGFDGYDLFCLLLIVCKQSPSVAKSKVIANGFNIFRKVERKPGAKIENQEQFRKKFHAAIEQAVELYQERNEINPKRTYLIELHGAGYSGVKIDTETAFELIYLGDEDFFAVIDIGVKELHEDYTVIYLSPGGHAPVPFEETWDDLRNIRPFKILLFLRPDTAQ